MRVMKYVLVMICMMQIVSAKRTGAPTVPVQTSIPTIQPVIKPTSTIIQPIIKPVIQPTQVIQPTLPQQSYANALNIIKNQMRSDQVLKNNQFTDQFINFVRDGVKNSGDNASIFARALLEAGAYLNATFTNEQVINVTIISDLNDEINRQMRAMQLQVQQPSVRITPIQPIVPEQIVEKTELAKAAMYLVPTDAHTLKNYDLCPLFGQEGGLYFVFNSKALLYSGETVARFEGEDVGKSAPCIALLGTFGVWNRTLIQLKTLNQFELADKTGLSAAMCGGLSLNNGRLIREYSSTGKLETLRKLHDIQDATNFLLNLEIGDWLNAAILRQNLEKLNQELGRDGIDVSAISTVSLFDSDLKNKFGFGLFDENEFDYVQKVKNNIREGLKKDNYMHVMIIGNEEIIEEALGHYFCFAIIKKGNEIQYIVLDTVPRAYHLQPGSHERDRLMFVIDNIERNASDIKVENIRIRRLEALEKERLSSLKK